MKKQNIILITLVLSVSFAACKKPTDDPAPNNQQSSGNTSPAATTSNSPAKHPAGTYYSGVNLSAYGATPADYCYNSGKAQLTGTMTTYDSNGTITNTQTFSNIPGNADIQKDCGAFLVNSGINYEYYFDSDNVLRASVGAGYVNPDCSFTYSQNASQEYHTWNNVGNAVRNDGYMNVIITDPNTHQTINSSQNQTDFPGFIFPCTLRR